ncbi:MAG: hypothetical protein ACRD1Z_10075, partial [Vicinamibacteria bacterium]
MFGRKAAQLCRVQVTHQTVERAAVRFEIETLDVQHSPIARLHDDGNPELSRLLPQKAFDVQAVTLINDNVELSSCNEVTAKVSLRDAFVEDRN